MLINFDETDWKSTTAADVSGNFTRLPAGGYICKIVTATIEKSKAGNMMLVLNLDIAEGKYANYFKNTQARFKNSKWSGDAIVRQVLRGRDGGVEPRFKGLIVTIEKSNSDFAFNPRAFEPENLQGLLVGCIFGGKEFRHNDGAIGVKAVAKFVRTVDDIRSGNFKLPELQKLGDEPATETGRQQAKTADSSATDGNTVDLEDPPF
ncbi:MAG: DUF669 domain-containing protein [Selenomonadaceae bacterium]|nr:DUF669 domain-containing protein [Selenomonadaceae bacterium]